MHGYTVERAEGVSEDEHERRVLAGYKAALTSTSIESRCCHVVADFVPRPSSL